MASVRPVVATEHCRRRWPVPGRPWVEVHALERHRRCGVALRWGRRATGPTSPRLRWQPSESSTACGPTNAAEPPPSRSPL